MGDVFALFVLQATLGVGEAVGNPSFQVIFVNHLDRNAEVREYSEWSLVATVSAGAGTLLGGYVVLAFGFTPLFFAMGALALVAFLGVLLQPREVL